MSVRRFVARLGVACVAVAVVLPAIPAYAVDPVTDLYVATPANGGDDGHDCSLASPCATVAQAILAADASGTTIHVAAGTFSGEIEPGSKSLTIQGVATDDTVLTTPQDSGDGYVVGITSGTTHLSDLTVQGGLFVDVFVLSGSLDADHVVLGHAGCGLVVTAGEADVSDSTVEDGGQGCVTGPAPGDMGIGLVVVTGGAASLVRTDVLNPTPSNAAVSVTGGAFTADQSSFDDPANDPDTNNSNGIHLTGGTATVTRSTFHGFGSSGVSNSGGTAFLGDNTFQGNVVGVTGSSGSTTVVRSTFTGELAALQSTVAIAGSVLGPDSLKNCGNTTLTDLGYNLATDDTCGFTATTSHGSVTGLHLDTALADRGGPVPTVAILNPSTAVDTIPAGATYGAPATPLCPVTGTTDLRGVPRPVGGACDAGSMELAGTTTTLTGPATARPHHAVILDAAVVVPDVGVDGLEFPVGPVAFRSGGQLLCQAPVQPTGDASCTTDGLGAGRHVVTATFVPGDGSTLHGSVSTGLRMRVGVPPKVSGPERVVLHVGRASAIRLTSSGQPSPLLTLGKGHLPRGLTFHRGHGTATITGVPKRSAVGRHHLRVDAANLMGSDTHSLVLVIKRG
jgi:hypothetical protein